MLLTPSAKEQGKLVEKVLRNADGRWVRATFYVYEQNGRMKGRLVDVVFLEELEISLGNAPVLVLVGSVAATVTPGILIKVSAIPSPYFTTDILNLAGIKPRAPTKK